MAEGSGRPVSPSVRYRCVASASTEARHRARRDEDNISSVCVSVWYAQPTMQRYRVGVSVCYAQPRRLTYRVRVCVFVLFAVDDTEYRVSVSVCYALPNRVLCLCAYDQMLLSLFSLWISLSDLHRIGYCWKIRTEIHATFEVVYLISIYLVINFEVLFMELLVFWRRCWSLWKIIMFLLVQIDLFQFASCNSKRILCNHNYGFRITFFFFLLSSVFATYGLIHDDRVYLFFI